MKVTRLISSTALLAALFVLVAHTTAAAQQAASAAQQAPDPARVTPASSAGASSPSALPGPRLSPEFTRAEPTLALSTTSAGQHTIVISTLALVLAVILLVLLIK
jgi:hypothetical protein